MTSSDTQLEDSTRVSLDWCLPSTVLNDTRRGWTEGRGSCLLENDRDGRRGITVPSSVLGVDFFRFSVTPSTEKPPGVFNGSPNPSYVFGLLRSGCVSLSGPDLHKVKTSVTWLVLNTCFRYLDS